MVAPPTAFIPDTPTVVSERPPRRSRTASERPTLAALSDPDHEILGLACAMRVVTQTQLERLHPQVPGVVLATQAAAAGLRLAGLSREADAREPFTDTKGRQRAIAPDLLIELHGNGDRQLLAHVELDLDTMRHARLRTKLDGYLAYAERDAWQARHPFAPALLVITTSRQRADTFRRSARRLVASNCRASAGGLPLFVCARARHLDAMPAAPCWLDVHHDEPTTLAEVLARARAPHDRQLARLEADRRERDAKRNRLLLRPRGDGRAPARAQRPAPCHRRAPAAARPGGLGAARRGGKRLRRDRAHRAARPRPRHRRTAPRSAP